MIKKLINAGLVFILLLAYSDSYAEKIFVLYGYKLGQKFSLPAGQLGEPFKTHKFEDGFTFNAFKMNDHLAVFESDNTRPDLIWSIQIQGKSNPPFHGLGEINLGDNVSKVIRVYGKPDSIQQAADETTGNPIEGVEYYSYNDSGNFSFEISGKTVTSIKIMFNGVKETKESSADIKSFLAAVRSKNLNKISSYIFADFELNGKKPVTISTSIVDALQNSKDINDIFFNPGYGIISVKDRDIVSSALRVETEPGSSGFVYRIKKNTAEYELYFFRSYDGWVLKYINQLN